jgi:hypothetical protein
MKHLVSLFLAVLLAGCATSRQAPVVDIARLLPGTWAMVTEVEGARIEARSTYDSSGKAEERVKVTQGAQTTEILARGLWRVEGDMIVTTYTESNAPALAAVGSVSRDRVTFIDDRQLSIVDEEGTAVTGYRVAGGL